MKTEGIEGWLIAERPHAHVLQIVPAVAVRDAGKFIPPTSATVIHPFEEQHWPALQMLLRDPDGREVGVNAPLPEATRSKQQGEQHGAG